MKTKSIIFALLACLTVGFSSCEDMLNANSERHSYTTATDTLYSYWGILKTLQNVGERYVLLGELRGDLVSATEFVSDTIAAIADFDNPQDGDCRYLHAADFYAIINNCNAYIAAADTARPIFGANAGMKYMLREYAQVWTIRAWTYMQLVQLYGKVPYYTDPLMSLADVEDFYNGGNCKTVDRYTLAEEIEKEAGERLPVLLDQDLPNYSDYGMVHSKYCFFPTRAVLGDLWLMAAQTKADYEKAAQYYYDYLRETKSILPSDYECSISRTTHYMSGDVEIYYSYSGQSRIFTQATSAPAATDEAITVIPSTTNRQWGIVQTGVNDIFGFSSELSVSSTGKGGGVDTIVTSASVRLERQFEQQCTGSQAFLDLAKAYPSFRIDDIETDENNEEYYHYELYKYKSNGEDEFASDARRAWLRSRRVENNEGLNVTKGYIEKQNPNGAFTSGFPVIYRKAAIWLRLAEAINRAGYPEHAFAILADGLDKDFMPRVVKRGSDDGTDYHVAFCTLNDTVADHLPVIRPAKDYEELLAMYEENPDSFAAAPIKSTQAIYIESMNDDDVLALLKSGDGAYVLHDKTASYTVMRERKERNLTTGMYIPLNQALKANDAPFLKFDDVNFTYKTVKQGDKDVIEGISHGVHNRGNGSILAIASDTLCPYYNFDVCVKSKWPDYKRLNYYAVDPGEYQAYQDRLIEAVEDLIIDEMGLELCFEGNRFNDLVRVAERRGDADWLAKKVAARKTGKWEDNADLRAKLLNKSNWYLQLPKF